MNRRNFFLEGDLTCKPLNSLKEMQLFVLDPPAWRTLCQPLTPHSRRVIKNKELNTYFDEITLELAPSYCHFDPYLDSVLSHDESTVPKVLVCHDMANGYHDDSIVDGTTNHEAYTFYNWAAIDIFCYFSHHMITIPPLGWINIAHAHGVKVIGTFITEWGEGIAFWNKILPNDEAIQNLISSLVTIAKTFKFEGWLINIENKISQPDKLIQFVQTLHKTLHQEIPDAVLIWYDSVTKGGQLSWQNALNEENRPFFDACDGLFTNYSWSEAHIASSVKEAGARWPDLYVGIDVWGRNFYGGGMFNTQEAVKLVHKYGCSLAIFAPAWTHEAMGEEGDSLDPHTIILGEDLPRYERFLVRDRALWDSLWPYLKTRLPCALPFKTSFCRGLGTKRRMYGEVLCNGPWYNLRHMQYQPNSAHGQHGYLLSTVEKIKKVSSFVSADKKGIIKFRQSLMQLNTLSKTEKNYDTGKTVQEDIPEENAIDEKCHTNLESKEDFSELERRKKISFNLCDLQVTLYGHKTAEDVRAERSAKQKKSETKVSRWKALYRKVFRQKKKDEPKVKKRQEYTDESEIAEPTELSSNDQSYSFLPSSGKSMQTVPVRLSLQIDKTRVTVACVAEEKECLKCCFEDSFNGGTCLKIHPSDPVSEEHRTIRLFHSDFYVDDTLIVCMATKVNLAFQHQWLNLILYVIDGGKERRIQLIGQAVNDQWSEVSKSRSIDREYPLDPYSKDFKELQSYLVVQEPGFYVPIENSFGWNIFYFQVPLKKVRVVSINLRTGEPTGAILLGHFGLCERRY